MDKKEVIRKLFDDVLNGGELAVLDELIAHDFEDHDAFSGQGVGSKGVKEKIDTWRQAFPDARFEIEAIVGESDMVAVLYRMEGTKADRFRGAQANGERVILQGVDFYRVEDGMIAEHWDCLDQLAMHGQMAA